MFYKSVALRFKCHAAEGQRVKASCGSLRYRAFETKMKGFKWLA